MVRSFVPGRRSDSLSHSRTRSYVRIYDFRFRNALKTFLKSKSRCLSQDLPSDCMPHCPTCELLLFSSNKMFEIRSDMEHKFQFYRIHKEVWQNDFLSLKPASTVYFEGSYKKHTFLVSYIYIYIYIYMDVCRSMASWSTLVCTCVNCAPLGKCSFVDLWKIIISYEMLDVICEYTELCLFF